jgi:prevent-host-death family protein
MYIMKRYTAAQARQRLARVLDEAERGEPVIIERRGVRFRVQTERKTSGSLKGKRYFRINDPAVERGTWTWNWEPGKLEFVPRPTRKRRK